MRHLLKFQVITFLVTLGLSSFVIKAAPPVVKHEPTTTEKALERNDHKKETRDESLSITPNGVYGYAKPPSSDTYEGEYGQRRDSHKAHHHGDANVYAENE